jgi:hypothetical protein
VKTNSNSIKNCASILKLENWGSWVKFRGTVEVIEIRLIEVLYVALTWNGMMSEGRKCYTTLTIILIEDVNHNFQNNKDKVKK